MFEIIILGCFGGPRESGLSGYLVGINGTYIALDAGSLLYGIEKAISKGHLTLKSSLQAFLQKQICGYLISHPHLDHILALVVASPADSKKPIFGADTTIDALISHVFNGVIWPNFGSEGQGAINRYTYVRLAFEKKIAIESTPFHVEPFLLNHSLSCPSTAFLISSDDHYLLYFGDTASDFVTLKKENKKIWQRVAPLIAQKKLRGIFLECSHTSSYQDGGSKSHLNPYLMIKELSYLESIAGSLVGLKVIVTHRKEDLSGKFDLLNIIKEELTSLNTLGIEFIFPSIGERYFF